MRELILKVWCDICALERVSGGLDIQVNVEAHHTYTIGAVVGESKPALKVLELCDTHNKVATDLIELLGHLGQTPTVAAHPVRPPIHTPEAVEHARRPVPCPACRTEIGRNTMVAHVWARHRTDERPDLKGVCPECRLRVDSNTGLSAHRRSAHGYDALEDALAGVDTDRWPALVSYRKNGAQL